ncbi:hypothetical protein C0992_005121 [Termitomyces sp. T32_za158]|nr:hypothetical protein C0992_005121 [Termitomyces sp. T32_za158]
MFSKHAVVLFLSKVKELLRMSSPLNYEGPEISREKTSQPISSYNEHLLVLHRSLEDAEACRIIRVTGWKKNTGSQHEFALVTITHGGQEAYVVFERGLDISSISESSTDSSASLSLAAPSRFKTNDSVDFPSSNYPDCDAKRIWKMDFDYPPPFYIAVTITYTIHSCFPHYVLSKTNCYFLVHVFQSMLLSHCKEFKPKVSAGDTLAGYTQGLKLWNPPLTPEEVEAKVNKEFDTQIKAFRRSLRPKVALAAEERRQLLQEADKRHQVVLKAAPSQLQTTLRADPVQNYSRYTQLHQDACTIAAIAEPCPATQAAFAHQYALDPALVFTDWTHLAAPAHSIVTLAFAAQGYHILCKPMANQML